MFKINLGDMAMIKREEKKKGNWKLKDRHCKPTVC